MFNHIMVGATDIEASKKFYDATLGVLGAKPGYQHIGHNGVVRYMYFLDGGTFMITEPLDGNDASHEMDLLPGLRQQILLLVMLGTKQAKRMVAWHVKILLESERREA